MTTPNNPSPPAEDNSRLSPDWQSRMLRKTRPHPVVDLVAANQTALYEISQLYETLREPLARVNHQPNVPGAFEALRMILESGESDLHGNPLFAKTAMIWGHCDKQVIAASSHTLKSFLELSEDIRWRTETLARALPNLKSYMDDTAWAALSPDKQRDYDDLFAVAAAQAERVSGIDGALQQAYETYQKTPHPEIDEASEKRGWVNGKK